MPAICDSACLRSWVQSHDTLKCRSVVKRGRAVHATKKSSAADNVVSSKSSASLATESLNEWIIVTKRPHVETISHKDDEATFRPVQLLQDLYMPSGKLTPDYINYQLWALPCHIFGWISNGLVTSALFKAVGVGAGPAEVTAAAASIKWLTRDGLGAMGRLVVGVRGGVQIDEDPRLWRMVAEAVATLGLALEVLSQFRPGAVAWFLALAGGGTFLRAMGKGLGRPSFRVIQTHFAAGCNVGDVAAKEEIWEVTGQLTGLGLSVALLSTLEDVKSPATVMGVWGLVQGIHVALRLQSLRQLQMGTINYKRAVILIRDFLAGKEVPSVADCCARESIASWDGVSQPQARIGCTLEEALAACALSTTPRDVPSALLREHCAVGAGYVAMVAEGRGWVFLERSSGQVDRLRGLFHALHLLEMGRQPRLAARTGTASDGAGGGSASSTGEGDRQVPASWSSGEAACEAVVAVDKERGAERRVRGAEEGAMAEYAETERDFAEFMRAAEAKGWRIDEDHVTLLSGDDRWSMRDPPGSGVAGEARPGMAVGSLSE